MQLVPETFDLEFFLEGRSGPRYGGFAGIVAQPTGHVDRRRPRRHADDAAGLAFPHPRQDLVNTSHGPLEVDLDGLPELLKRFLECELAVSDAGVVDENVDGTQSVGDGRERVSNRLDVRNVTRVRFNFDTLELFARGLGLLLPINAEVEKSEVRSRIGQGNGYGSTDACLEFR